VTMKAPRWTVYARIVSARRPQADVAIQE
jgi:hypothetical protein